MEFSKNIIMVIWQNKVVKEAAKQIRLAAPMLSVYLLQRLVQMISLIFVGHHDGELPLSGASMATSFAGVTGFNLVFGVISALDTLCGQFFGAQQYHMLGIQMQRAMIIMIATSVIVAIIWANTTPILIGMHQDHEISREAGRYALFLIPGILPYALLQCCHSFLQNQNIVFPMALCCGITASLHILFCWTLVFKSGLGSRGAALATALSYWSNLVLVALYIKFCSLCKRTWTGFSKDAFYELLPFLKLALPATLMECFRKWAFELVVILSGFLPDPKLEASVLSICLNSFQLLWAIPAGLMAAVSIRVAHELGDQNPKTARFAVHVVLILVAIEGFLVVLAVILMRKIWGGFYSNDQKVVRAVESLTPLLAIACFLDGVQCVLSGIARGCGWQKIGAYINLAAFYVVGVPGQVILAFVLHMKAKGLWMGIIAAFIVQILFYGIFVARTNWEKEAVKTGKRVNDYTTTESAPDQPLLNDHDC